MFVKIDQPIPNSLVLLMDHSVGVPPDSLGSAIVAATPTCIAIGTVSEFDHSVSIAITDNYEAKNIGLVKVHAGVLSVPTMNLSLVNTANAILATAGVDSTSTSIEVWVDDQREPTEIVIYV